MRRSTIVAWVGLLGMACTRTAPGGAPEPDGAPTLARSGPGARLAASAALDETLLAEAPEGDWVDRVREHRFSDAAKLLDRLEPKARQRPTVRYVRAVVADRLSDPTRVVKELTGLAKELPLLSAEIEELHAKAALEVGPFDVAARYYGQRSDSQSLCRAALALERSKDLDKAKAASQRAVQAAQRAKGKSALEAEAEARATRARIAELQGDTASAVADLRWLALTVPASRHAIDAEVRLEKLVPKQKLTAKERYGRALEFAAVGNTVAVEREFDALATAPGTQPSLGEKLHAQGQALYFARRDYAKAAELLEKASKSGSPNAVRDLFYAARSRSRAHEDDRAIQMYGQLARRFPRASLAEDSRFLAARLHYILGRWDTAAKGYEGYLARHKNGGRYLDSAAYERAVSFLASGKHTKAEKEFAELARSTNNALNKARFVQLQGVALAGGGKKAKAIEVFRSVVADQPLSFPALAAAKRLETLDAPLPPSIQPAKTSPARPPLSVELPPKAKLFVRMGLDDAAEAEITKHEAKLRAQYGARADEALCQVYGQLTRASRRYHVGQKAARWSELAQAPGADSRWLWECIYPMPYEPIVRQAEDRFSLPTNFVYAIMRQESAFAPGVVSSARAVGLMQLIPPTATAVAKELDLSFEPELLYSPAVNIEMGSYYLSKVLSTFGGNVALAAAAYNAGPSAVSRWLQTGEKLPLDVWVARIPYLETRGYVTRVMGNIARYAFLTGGESAVPTVSLELPQGLRAPDDAY